MITILTTTNHYLNVESTIQSINRLDELVNVTTNNVEQFNNKIIRVKNDSIIPSLDWFDTEVPYVFPTLPFTENHLLAIVFYQLANYEKAFEFVTEQDELFQHLMIATALLNGAPISNEQIEFVNQSSNHNLAIVYNFGNINSQIDRQQLEFTYESAIQNANNDSLRLFSAKHYVNYYLDSGLNEKAETLLRSVKPLTSTDAEQNAINNLLSAAMMAQLSIPFNENKLDEIAKLQAKSIQYYEENNLKVNAGLLLINASEIASYQKDYINAKELINKAILYFKEEEIELFLGEATVQKAILLYNWSKNGSPQYYKPAINTFQNALKVFKRDTYPQKFADIHHNLALIYSEIQVSEEEKAIWTAFSASSFKEALQFYDKDQYPYQFAMVAHNYATALMGFPEAKLHNNLTKAAGFFNDALQIRTAEQFPFERALSLLNQLELYWLIHNETNEDEAKQFDVMMQNVNEIKELVTDKTLLEQADEHLNELVKLSSMIN